MLLLRPQQPGVGPKIDMIRQGGAGGLVLNVHMAALEPRPIVRSVTADDHGDRASLFPLARQIPARPTFGAVYAPATAPIQANVPPDVRRTGLPAMPPLEDCVEAEEGWGGGPSYIRCLLTAPGPKLPGLTTL